MNVYSSLFSRMVSVAWSVLLSGCWSGALKDIQHLAPASWAGAHRPLLRLDCEEIKMIEVWKRPFFTPLSGYRKVSSHLTVTLGGQPRDRHAYALVQGTLFGPKIPVSDELATDTLDIRHEPCPYSGKEPEFGLYRSGYKCFSMDEGRVTVLDCDTCGYWESFTGNPYANIAAGRKPGEGKVHPSRTYLVSERPFGTIEDAVWSNGQLQPGRNSGTLVIWLKGMWHTEKDGAWHAAKRQFPNARCLADRRRYLILHDEEP